MQVLFLDYVVHPSPSFSFLFHLVLVIIILVVLHIELSNAKHPKLLGIGFLEGN